jgi:hypothetical protein
MRPISPAFSLNYVVLNQKYSSYLLAAVLKSILFPTCNLQFSAKIQISILFNVLEDQISNGFKSLRKGISPCFEFVIVHDHLLMK